MAGKEESEPNYGRRLLPDVLEDKSTREPNLTWMRVPRSSDGEIEWEDITFRQAANAINNAAHKIVELSGNPKPDEFPVIAYIGPNDIRYLIFMLAAGRAGYQALFISPRNSEEAQLSLFEKTNCRIIWYDAVFQSVVQPWLEVRQMQAIKTDPAQQWFPTHEVTRFPWQKTFDEAKWDPLVILHTSGSTGIPKPITCSHGFFATFDRSHNHPEWQETKTVLHSWTESMDTLFLPLPLFHAAGVYISLMMSVYWNKVVALGLPNKPLSSDSVVECLSTIDAQGTMLPPSILEDMSQSQVAINELAKLNRVVFGGGQLSEEAGDRLVRNGVPVQNSMGTTEFGFFPLYRQPDFNLWRWFYVNTEELGCEWRKVENSENLFELVLVRKPDDADMQGCFYTFPDLKELSTKDIYRSHPTLPNHWLYEGRLDDVIVFSNGEKFNPATTEGIMMSHPAVKGALVVGSKRFQPSLILEPREPINSEEDANAFIATVWPLVQDANKRAVAHGQIDRKFITVAKPDRPFPRAGKGTIQRPNAEQVYVDIIDELYRNASMASTEEAIDLDFSSEEALTGTIMNIFTLLPTQDIPNLDADIFEAGVDSLQVVGASRVLQATLKAAGKEIRQDAISVRAVYQHPTPRRLGKYIYSLLTDEVHDLDEEGLEIAEMKRQLDKYTLDLPTLKTDKPAPEDEGQVVVLTGSTGSLGSQLLDLLSACTKVKKVVCLNRAPDGLERQKSMSSTRGLATRFEKAVFLQADLSKPQLGLEIEVFNQLQHEVDRIIHCQWPVNFNLTTEHFEPHVRGVRHLVDFSAGAEKRAPIIFISSIGSVDRWTQTPVVPEESITDLSISSNGYGRSKHISGLLLEQAAKTSAVPSSIIRVGQIAGSKSAKSVWNKHEWLPSIVASSVYLGILPRDLGMMQTIDWVPIEDIANMILEVSGITTSRPIEEISGYFHGVNPSTTTWTDLTAAIMEFYGNRITRLVTFSEWVDALEESQWTTPDVADNPAIKLLSTYRGMVTTSQSGQHHVRLDMTRTREISRSVRDLEAISPQLMKLWCDQWQF